MKTINKKAPPAAQYRWALFTQETDPTTHPTMPLKALRRKKVERTNKGKITLFMSSTLRSVFILMAFKSKADEKGKNSRGSKKIPTCLGLGKIFQYLMSDDWREN